MGRSLKFVSCFSCVFLGSLQIFHFPPTLRSEGVPCKEPTGKLEGVCRPDGLTTCPWYFPASHPVSCDLKESGPSEDQYQSNYWCQSWELVPVRSSIQWAFPSNCCMKCRRLATGWRVMCSAWTSFAQTCTANKMHLSFVTVLFNIVYDLLFVCSMASQSRKVN